MKRTRLFSLALLLGLLCLGTAAVATVHTVNVNNFNFAPASLNVSVGDTVRFVGQSGTHTATSTSVPSGAASFDGAVGTGQVFEYEVTEAGTYNYKCAFHPSMVGSFTATAASATQPDAAQALDLHLGPNPVAATGTLTLTLTQPQPGALTATLLDVTGRTVATLAATPTLPAGLHTLALNLAAAAPQATGLYLIRVQAAGLSHTQRLLVVGQ